MKERRKRRERGYHQIPLLAEFEGEEESETRHKGDNERNSDGGAYLKKS